MYTYTAWLFDILPQKDYIIMYWVTDQNKTIRCYFKQVYASIYAHIYNNTQFHSMIEGLRSHPDVIDVKQVKKRVSIHNKHYSTVLEILIPLHLNTQKFVHSIRDVFPLSLYNTDLSTFQYFFHKTKLFPFCKAKIIINNQQFIESVEILDKLTQFNYDLPPVKAVQMDISFVSAIRRDKIKSVTFTLLDNKLHERSKNQYMIYRLPEAKIITETISWLNKCNPDVIVTHGGDSTLRLFAGRAVKHGYGYLSFSREKNIDQFYRIANYVKPKGTSYMSYGGHYYKDNGYYLYGGRHHIDLRNSFTWQDGGFAGMVELARLSCIDAQRCARGSIGTNLTGMQIREAITWDILIPSRKADAERFRSGESLIIGDRGGFIYSPRVGLHFNVAGIDFSSMFPNIMVKHNISPETVNCECCVEDGKPIPGTDSWYTCQERKGLVPLVLKTVLDKRLFYKQFKDTNKSYDQLQKTLKWILVTCFEENTLLPIHVDNKLKLVRIGKFIDDLLDNKSDVGKISIIGLDTSSKTILNPIKRAYRLPSPPTLLHIHMTSGHAISVTKDHICYEVISGKLHEKRADQLKVGNYLPCLPLLIGYKKDTTIQNLLVDSFKPIQISKILETPSSSKNVYCLEVENQLPGFFAGTGGIFTHNCFGYQGYRNARFGRIEAHEAINAYARYSLLVSGEIMQREGFEIVAGIVDSLWGKYSSEEKVDASVIKNICHEVEQATELPIDHEGTFRWIVFLPRRHEPEVGVLNRYYGCFEDGTFKVRGIELRRRDTCEFIKSAQMEALETIAPAKSKEEFFNILTGKYWEVHEKYDAMLRNREVPVEQLFIKKIMAKEPHQYVQAVHQAIAAQQLAKAGVHLQSGMKVQFLVTDYEAKSTNKRVIASDLYKNQLFDVKWYQKMLKEAFTNIIPPAFTEKPPSSLRLEDFATLFSNEYATKIR